MSSEPRFAFTPEQQARWAEEKGGGIQSRELRWQHAIQVFSQISWPATAAEKILEAVKEPDQLEALACFWAEEKDQSLAAMDQLCQVWLQRVDDTGLALDEWLEAYAVLSRFLQEQGRKTSFELATGFISCSEEAAGMGYGHGRVADVVLQMLKEYGYEG